MTLHPTLKIDGLLKEYPFLMDFLVKEYPAFQKLKNPVLRKTVGKVATIAQAASMVNIDVSTLLSQIAAQVERESGQKPEMAPAPDQGGSDRFLDGASRQEVLKDIIRDLHAGKEMEELKRR